MSKELKMGQFSVAYSPERNCVCLRATIGETFIEADMDDMEAVTLANSLLSHSTMVDLDRETYLEYTEPDERTFKEKVADHCSEISNKQRP